MLVQAPTCQRPSATGSSRSADTTHLGWVCRERSRLGRRRTFRVFIQGHGDALSTTQRLVRAREASRGLDRLGQRGLVPRTPKGQASGTPPRSQVPDRGASDPSPTSTTGRLGLTLGSPDAVVVSVPREARARELLRPALSHRVRSAASSDCSRLWTWRPWPRTRR